MKIKIAEFRCPPKYSFCYLLVKKFIKACSVCLKLSLTYALMVGLISPCTFFLIHQFKGCNWAFEFVCDYVNKKVRSKTLHSAQTSSQSAILAYALSLYRPLHSFFKLLILISLFCFQNFPWPLLNIDSFAGLASHLATCRYQTIWSFACPMAPSLAYCAMSRHPSWSQREPPYYCHPALIVCRC